MKPTSGGGGSGGANRFSDDSSGASGVSRDAFAVKQAGHYGTGNKILFYPRRFHGSTLRCALGGVCLLLTSGSTTCCLPSANIEDKLVLHVRDGKKLVILPLVEGSTDAEGTYVDAVEEEGFLCSRCT
jgi:hypothetical protein